MTDELKQALLLIKAECSRHILCYPCQLKINGSCILDHSIPAKWEVGDE